MFFATPRIDIISCNIFGENSSRQVLTAQSLHLALDTPFCSVRSGRGSRLHSHQDAEGSRGCIPEREIQVFKSGNCF